MLVVPSLICGEYTGQNIIQTSIYGRQNSLLQDESTNDQTWRQVRRSVTEVSSVFLSADDKPFMAIEILVIVNFGLNFNLTAYKWKGSYLTVQPLCSVQCLRGYSSSLCHLLPWEQVKQFFSTQLMPMVSPFCNFLSQGLF